MNRMKIAVTGGLVGVSSQLITSVVNFMVRTFFIRYLGSEILGLESVLLDVISILSLTEMGITTAMLYKMYNPIIHKDEEKIDRLLASYKLVYRMIALCILIFGIVISIFLPTIVKEVSIGEGTVYSAYYIHLATTVSSYFLSYQRILLNADQKKHLCILTDSVVHLFCSIGRVIALVGFRSYIIYLLVLLLETIGSNIFLKFYVNRKYLYIHKFTKYEKNDIRDIAKDAKQVLIGKLAGYVYFSTDSIIISAFLGTGIVGLLANYKFITSLFKTLMNNAVATVQPLIGNYLNSDTPKSQSIIFLNRYTFIRFIFAGITTVPFISLSNLFIIIWTGNQSYVMNEIITILLAMEYYIACLCGPFGEFLNGLGMFKGFKYVQLASAICNLLLSLLMVKNWGCSGVLFATAFGQAITWVGSANIIFKIYYAEFPEFRFDYIKRIIKMIMLTVGCSVLSTRVNSMLNIKILEVKFIVAGIASELIFVLIIVFCYRKTDEFIFTLETLKKMKLKKKA